jgi:hypothetical protein
MGRGGYWNCNAEKSRYKRLGIGMIEHDDQQKREVLLRDVISYLAKTDQQLRSSKLSSDQNDQDAAKDQLRLFVTGQIPQKRVGKAGRKRRGISQ